MIWLALVIGALSGMTIVMAMYRARMLHERSGLTVLLAAIAFFYPVFAAADGDWASFALHIVIFLAFALLAVQGWKKGLYLIIGGLIAHAIFDFGLIFIGQPGPEWWPIFCAALDLVAGVIVLRLLQLNRIPL